jgi:TPP-dependent 2-oxoacid decarboxylase
LWKKCQSLLIISGAQGIKERAKNPLLHHKVKEFETQLNVFKELTVASTVLDHQETAFREIDRVLSMASRHKQPVYIELPRDMVSVLGFDSQKYPPPDDAAVHTPAMLEALKEMEHKINGAKKPVIIAGIEVHRFGLQNALLEFIEKTNIPVAAMPLSKSVISECHPLYIGVYAGKMGNKDVFEYVESSDCLILLGVLMTDINLGLYTANIEPKNAIHVTSEYTAIQYHTYNEVTLEELMPRLLQAKIHRKPLGQIPHPNIVALWQPISGQNITVDRLFQQLNAFITDKTVVITDAGDSTFGAIEMCIGDAAGFLTPAYYTSLGFSVPASIGVQMADSESRALVIVGDGAFQMTGMELSTIARYHLNPIILVLNNRGYATERLMKDGTFNDICPWKYSHIPDLLGVGRGFEVQTEDELEKALQTCREHTETYCIVDIHLDPYDCSVALKRLMTMLQKQV